MNWVEGHMDLVEKVKAKQDKKEADQWKKALIDAPSGLGLSPHAYSTLAAQQSMACNAFGSAFETSWRGHEHAATQHVRRLYPQR